MDAPPGLEHRRQPLQAPPGLDGPSWEAPLYGAARSVQYQPMPVSLRRALILLPRRPQCTVPERPMLGVRVPPGNSSWVNCGGPGWADAAMFSSASPGPADAEAHATLRRQWLSSQVKPALLHTTPRPGRASTAGQATDRRPYGPAARTPSASSSSGCRAARASGTSSQTPPPQETPPPAAFAVASAVALAAEKGQPLPALPFRYARRPHIRDTFKSTVSALCLDAAVPRYVQGSGAGQ